MNDGVPAVLSLLACSEAVVHTVASLLTEFKTANADQGEPQSFCGLPGALLSLFCRRGHRAVRECLSARLAAQLF